MDIGKAVKSRRLEKGYKQYALADLAGVEQSSLCAVEHSKKNTRIQTLMAIADALDVKLSVLIAEAEQYE